MRYKYTDTLVRYDGKRVFASTYYPTIETKDTDVFVITNETTTLDALAYKYYKNPAFWWVIAVANNVGTGRLSVEAGKQLRIPTDIENIVRDLKIVNL